MEEPNEKGGTTCIRRRSSAIEEDDSLASCASKKLAACCSKKTLYKRLPVLRWLPRYNLEDAVGDLVAGTTVGLTVIPQSLAYANVAGLPPQVR